jgi:hypothetical protein
VLKMLVPCLFCVGFCVVLVISAMLALKGLLWGWVLFSVEAFNGEFDPGSGRTLAACLTHASRAVRPFRGYTSGERVSNTWVTCP